MENQLPSLEEFEKMCSVHDWYYDWTDDPSVWNRGNINQKKLQALANQDERLKEIFYRHKEKFFPVKQPA